MNDAAGSPTGALLRLLDREGPARLLSVSDSRIPAVDQYVNEHPCVVLEQRASNVALSALEALGRFDVALVADALEHCDHRHAQQLLARLRNLHSEHVWVVVDERSPLNRNEFFGLGLQRAAQFDAAGERQLALYTYDLAHYNRVRDWNNPRYWANPENWGKYWW